MALMAAAVAILKENMEGFNEALEKAQKSFLNDTSVNEGLEGLSVSDHKRNMAAALARLIEKFETINEALEGPSIPDLKRNMATPEASSTENLPSLKEALEKAKKLLLQRVQNLEGKIDEQREVSSLNEGTKCNTASAVVSLTENLLNEALEGLSVSDDKRKRKRAAELASLKERIQSINEAIEESNKLWSQRNPIFAEKKDMPRVGGLSLEYLRTSLEYAQKVNEDLSEWLQNRKGMDELMKNLVEEYMVDADQFDSMEYGVH